MAKFFIFPFAEAGDKTAIPDDTQVSGSVSYEEGWGFDYQRNLATDPLAKAYPRGGTNQLFYDITNAIRQYQTTGFPDFIEPSDNDGDPFPYPIFAVVRYDDGGGVKLYENQVADNETDPTDPSWKLISGGALPSGTILDFGGDTVPTGFLPCDGTTRLKADFPDLYAVITNIWGSDSGSSFTLPDFRRRVGVGSGGTASTDPLGIGNAVGDIGGEESHTPTLAEMFSHNHSGSICGVELDQKSGAAGNNGVVIPGTGYTPHNLSLSIATNGSSSPFNIIQPSAIVTKIIKY